VCVLPGMAEGALIELYCFMLSSQGEKCADLQGGKCRKNRGIE